jgi:predicted nucleotidyltransferase component of viral defense system
MNIDPVDPSQLALLKDLFEKPYLREYYLVGGTNLAIRYGHRHSIDLDLFNFKPFNKEYSDYLHKQLHDDFSVRYISGSVTGVGVFGFIDDIKVDFVNYPYPLLKPPVKVDNYFLADIDDIAAMKLNAVTGRGSKKDFYDIYELLQHFSLDRLLDAFKRKYKIDNLFQVKKSLIYFLDAEDPDNKNNTVVSTKNIPWMHIKKTITLAVQEEFKQNKGKML